MERLEQTTVPARAGNTAAATPAPAPGEETPAPASFTASAETAAPALSVVPEIPSLTLRDHLKIFMSASSSSTL